MCPAFPHSSHVSSLREEHEHLADAALESVMIIHGGPWWRETTMNTIPKFGDQPVVVQGDLATISPWFPGSDGLTK